MQDILSIQETEVLRAIHHIGVARTTQLISFYQNVFTAGPVKISERVMTRESNKLLAAFPTICSGRGRKKDPNSAFGKISSSVFSAIKNNIHSKNKIIQFVIKTHPELSIKQINDNMYSIKNINRKYGIWTLQK